MVGFVAYVLGTAGDCVKELAQNPPRQADTTFNRLDRNGDMWIPLRRNSRADAALPAGESASKLPEKLSARLIPQAS